MELIKTLKPCPWCKTKPEVKVIRQGDPQFSDEFAVGCMNMDCPVKPFSIGWGSVIKAIEGWNNRPGDEEEWPEQEFKEGDRVTMSNHALKLGTNGRLDRRDGVFVRYSRDPEVIVVRRDGRKIFEYFHKTFWVNCEVKPEVDSSKPVNNQNDFSLFGGSRVL